jgi:hypothetical protein
MNIMRICWKLWSRAEPPEYIVLSVPMPGVSGAAITDYTIKALEPSLLDAPFCAGSKLIGLPYSDRTPKLLKESPALPC